MTQLFDPPLAVSVGLGLEGAPRFLDGWLAGHVEPVSRWLAEIDWWRRPVAREYWKVLLDERVLLEVFHDLIVDAWYLERVYD